MVTVDAFRNVGSGKTAEKQLFDPVMLFLRNHERDDIRVNLSAPSKSHRERLADAALPLIRDYRHGVSPSEPAMAILKQLAAAFALIADADEGASDAN